MWLSMPFGRIYSTAGSYGGTTGHWPQKNDEIDRELSKENYIVFTGRKSFLMGTVWEQCGGSAFGNVDTHDVTIDINTDGTVRCGLGGAYPVNAITTLGINEEMLVAWLVGVGTDARQCLIKPNADAVVTVVYSTSLAIP